MIDIDRWYIIGDSDRYRKPNFVSLPQIAPLFPFPCSPLWKHQVAFLIWK